MLSRLSRREDLRLHRGLGLGRPRRSAQLPKLHGVSACCSPVAKSGHRDDVRRPELIHNLEEAISRFKASNFHTEPV